MRHAVSEKSIQTGIKAYLRMVGAAVFDTSQPFRAAITPGVPDLLVFYRGQFAFVEVKRPGGQPTVAQKAFRDECAESKIEWHCWDSVYHAIEWVSQRRAA